MKVMTWNIRNGGQDRLDRIRDVIRAERPDILALQELKGWTAARLDEFAAGVGMTGHRSGDGLGQPVAVLSTRPARFSGTIVHRLHHAAVALEVGPLTVISTHLDPSSPSSRLSEVTLLLTKRWLRRRRVLVAGDLNGLAPGADLTGLPAAYRKRHYARDGSLDTRAVGAFLEAGFVDLAAPGPTVPTGLGGHEFAPMRLDYLLATEPVAARAHDPRVVREAGRASDHYPVTATLDI